MKTRSWWWGALYGLFALVAVAVAMVRAVGTGDFPAMLCGALIGVILVWCAGTLWRNR